MAINELRIQVRVKGVVQGVGFRPFVWNRASELGLTGWVNNNSSGVTIELQGTIEKVSDFLKGFREAIPPLARIDSLVTSQIGLLPETGFTIRESAAIASCSTPISPEISICADCLRELNNPADRRYRYPFINCTHCGPRFTIIEDIPYDRSLTSMKSFPMCESCQKEYDDPAERRFHAQPNACPVCGPGIWWLGGDAGEEAFDKRPVSSMDNDSVIRAFCDAIRAGQIVAIKGVGGFHLACDARNSDAIMRLRERKGRIDKPFAVMVHDVETARGFAVISSDEERLMEGPERPILLLQKQTPEEIVGQPLSPMVAPGNNFIGVMLPYSPLHYLVTRESPLVMTSGNLSDEPIFRTNSDAFHRARGLADSFLLHDRDIIVVCDDSVVRCVDSSILPIRRSRGYAPMPVRLSAVGPEVLAIGGEIKSAFCVTKGNYAYMSQHIGDMGNLETLEAMHRCVDHFLRLFRIQPEAVVTDLHPGYLSGEWGEQFAKRHGLQFVRVQHHFAHVAGLHAEHGLSPEQKILGCCFDGTGYGPDGSVWGGEFLIADGRGYQRYAHLKYSPLPGGEAGIRRPWRMALAQLWANDIKWDGELPCVAACSDEERNLLLRQLERNLNCVSTSSMGRLFDTVASLAGIRQQVNYEAQAAMEMESMAAPSMGTVNPADYAFQTQGTTPVKIDFRELLNQICFDLKQGVSSPEIAAKFHHAVARMIVDVCIGARRKTRLDIVGLTGGVFQNVILLRVVAEMLARNGFGVLTHSVVPPNDGGLALGQAVIVRNRLQESRLAFTD